MYFIQPILQKNSIQFIKACSNYSTVYFEDAKNLTIAKVLKKVAIELPTDEYIRIHQSFLVNKKYIKAILYNRRTVIMQDNTKLPISRRKSKELLLQNANH